MNTDYDPIKVANDRLNAGFKRYDIPGYMQEGIRGYVLNGREVGGFLSALFSNDLRHTFERADLTNQRKVGDYVRFMFNNMPAGSWGNERNFTEWKNREGVAGIWREEAISKEQEEDHDNLAG